MVAQTLLSVGIQETTTPSLVPSTAAASGYAHPRSDQSLFEQYFSDPLNQQQRTMIVELANLGSLSTVSAVWPQACTNCPSEYYSLWMDASVLHQKGVSNYPWFLLCGVGLRSISLLQQNWMLPMPKSALSLLFCKALLLLSN